MSKTNFFFIALAYLLFAIFSWVQNVEISTQLAVSGTFLLLVGIPHGAIDHILFLESRKTSPILFYASYFGLMGAYIALWFIFPFASFVFFLLMSAYHFGQSQFSEIVSIPKFIKQALYTTWGVSILSGLLFYNLDELTALFNGSTDLAFISNYFSDESFKVITIISSAFDIIFICSCRC